MIMIDAQDALKSVIFSIVMKVLGSRLDTKLLTVLIAQANLVLNVSKELTTSLTSVTNVKMILMVISQDVFKHAHPNSMTMVTFALDAD